LIWMSASARPKTSWSRSRCSINRTRIISRKSSWPELHTISKFPKVTLPTYSKLRLLICQKLSRSALMSSPATVSKMTTQRILLITRRAWRWRITKRSSLVLLRSSSVHALSNLLRMNSLWARPTRPRRLPCLIHGFPSSKLMKKTKRRKMTKAKGSLKVLARSVLVMLTQMTTVLSLEPAKTARLILRSRCPKMPRTLLLRAASIRSLP